MKRTVPLQRTTPLTSRAPLTRSTPLQAKTPLRNLPLPRPGASLPSQKPKGGTTTPPSPRKAPGRRQATPEERAARGIVQARSQGMCEMGCGMPGQDWSHRRSVAQGGAWRAVNGLKACRRCHHATEVTAPLLADLGGWRIVHRDPDPATAPVYLQAVPGRPAGWYFLTDGTDIEPAPWAPAPLWFPWMPRPR